MKNNSTEKQRIVSILLVLIISLGILIGCSTSSKDDNTSMKNDNTKTENMPKTGEIGGGLGGGTIDTSNITRKWTNVAYGTKSEAEKLDIYLPNEGEGPFPVIIAIHGGGFKVGSKDGADLKAMIDGVNRGYAVVSVGYRLSDEAKFPAAINDCKAAVRFIRENATKYMLNPDKIAAWGGSSGGNLASLIGTTGGTNELYDTSLGYGNVSDAVSAVVDWFGPTNFYVMDNENKESGIKDRVENVQVHSVANSFESEYLGKNVAEAEDLCKEADPTTYITDKCPPFFIEHGTDDGNVPTQQSVNFAEALEKVIGKDKVTLILIEGAGHGGSQFETTDNLNKVYSFLDKYMK